MWVEIEEDLAAAIQGEIVLSESGERIVQRLLLEALRGRTAVPRRAARTRVAVSGSLKQLLDAGLIAEDDEIRFTEVRRGTVHMGRIDADGRIHTDKGVQTSPSTALRQLLNYSMNGWKYWIHVPTGKTLAELRGELGSQQLDGWRWQTTGAKSNFVPSSCRPVVLSSSRPVPCPVGFRVWPSLRCPVGLLRDPVGLSPCPVGSDNPGAMGRRDAPAALSPRWGRQRRWLLARAGYRAVTRLDRPDAAPSPTGLRAWTVNR